MSHLGNSKSMMDPAADLRGAQPAPQGPKMFSISCSFSEILAKSHVGASPYAWRIGAPPKENSGSAPEIYIKKSLNLPPHTNFMGFFVFVFFMGGGRNVANMECAPHPRV